MREPGRQREAELLELRDRRELRADLEELVERIEAIDWRAVPNVSPETASVAAGRLQEARDALEGGGPE